MKSLNKIIVIGVCIATTMGCNSNSEVKENYNQQNVVVMNKKDKQQIESLLGEYKKSLNTSDAELSRSLYAKDGIFMPSSAPSANGSEEILKSYEYVFSQIQLNIEFFVDEIVVEGDFAFATTTSKGTALIHETAETVHEENRELFVFEKIDSEWKIVRYMFNKMSPQN